MKPSLLVLKIFENVIFRVLNNDFPTLRIYFLWENGEGEITKVNNKSFNATRKKNVIKFSKKKKIDI